MKCQDLFSLKNKKKNKKLSSAAVVIGTLRVNNIYLIPLLSGALCLNRLSKPEIHTETVELDYKKT